MKLLAPLSFAAIALGGELRTPAVTNAPPPDALALRRFEWISPFPAPRVVAARFPRENPVASVEALTIGDNRVWAALRPRRATNLTSGWGQLWAYSDQQGSVDLVRGALEQHAVKGMAADSQRLWLALDGGLASLDFATGIVDPYGPAQGFFSTNLAGVGLVDGTVVAMGRFGLLWGMPQGTTNFVRATGAAPPDNPRQPAPWNWFATSGDWMAGVSTAGMALRNWRSQDWIGMREEFANGSPQLAPPEFRCVVGDGDGGFWLGSNAGLHWVNPETGVVENRFATVSVTVPGGLGLAVAPGFQPTPAAYEMARNRVMNGVRERMRDRARYARLNTGLKEPVDPVWPTSRIPGGVTALARDGQFLWIATTDGNTVTRARVLLMHQPTRRWIGWFPVGAPVVAMTADPQRLWLGLDCTRAPQISPLMVVNRPPLVGVPQTKWIKDTISAEELGTRLANLPVKERAVLALFDRDPEKVVELLAPGGEPSDEADAETLFLLAFAHDAVGLNRPERLDHFIGLLRERHPDSLFAELAAGVRSARPAEIVEDPEDAPPPTPVVAPPVPVAEEPPAAAATEDESARALAVLTRRDLNQDGALNLVEFRLWRGPQADFPAFDADRDGRLDVNEIIVVLRLTDSSPGAPPTDPGK